MEHLLSLAYKFAKEEKIPYPSIWKFNKADELWLLEFHMRNSEEMVRRFPPASSCTKEPPASTCAWESSSLLEQQEISEPSTSSYAHQPKRLKLSQDSNVRKSDIQTRIKRHLEISDQLDKAAKKVLEEYKDIARVAREYQLNPWILKQKVDIIELRKKQFFWKCKVEPAVHAVRFNILSVCDAAKEYKVEESDIHNRLKQLKNPKSCIYLHETIKTDDKVLSCEEEFLLLKKLEAEVNDDRNRNCGCRTCSLQILRHLAYQFAVENKKQYPSAWNNNKVADEVWLLQFEMRHSIEISEYFDMNV
ncbi:unnamed protein product [Lasius platythorax]|uniref:Uncharacterized protein n=1 Tax=Lasius platythorax TaxID=488582 RepID=A0AAV2NN46_9HYME